MYLLLLFFFSFLESFSHRRPEDDDIADDSCNTDNDTGESLYPSRIFGQVIFVLSFLKFDGFLIFLNLSFLFDLLLRWIS